MSRRQTISLTEAWWVWVGEAPAVRVATEQEAIDVMLRHARDFEIGNSHGRSDVARPIVELLRSDPLPEGKCFHKVVFSPVRTVLRRGQLRKVVDHLSPSRFASIAKGWYELEPRLPAWLPRQYLAAINDPETLTLRGSKPIEAQIDIRWPNTQ
ncbi:hypothetical protein BDI4_660046 [Burkholderia diffusa]|uniref:hypothetical protein n=1 Tax=Burkholderia diffusa TaxID=488732 RepID=UPI001CAF701B|nr:hypothetical protein [Burkholderia diffusa]CAG9260990.1 hypothetical protein BDI4_660046 [Burkholderia diffusa]